MEDIAPVYGGGDATGGKGGVKRVECNSEISNLNRTVLPGNRLGYLIARYDVDYIDVGESAGYTISSLMCDFEARV